MIIHQGFQFRIEPNGEQLRLMRQFAGMNRFILNKALAIQLDEKESTGKKTSGYKVLCKNLTQWRNSDDTPWLESGPSQVQQQALKDLETGWKNHFDSLKKLKKGLIKLDAVVQPPVFRKKGQSEKFRFPSPKQFKVDEAGKRIFLPKLGWVPYRRSCFLKGAPRSITVKLIAGHWYVSILTEREVAQPRHPASSAGGIDVGVARFATLWDGEKETVIKPLNSFRKLEKQLTKLQRQLKHKVKFSNNWSNLQARIRLLHHRIACARNDFLHKTSHSLSKNHALLCVEDLQIKNMSASAAGTLGNPGRNVKSKSGLNKSILDQGWGEFRRQLEYKCEWRGGWLVAVPPANTSRTCPSCNHISAENRLTQSVFLCIECGHAENADLVASKNIRERGLKLLEGQDYGRIACEVNGAVRPSAAGTHRSDQSANAA